MTKKQTIGWILLASVWAGVGLRWLYPADLHGGYTGILGLAIQCIDFTLIMPSWVLLAAIIPPSKAPWIFITGTVVWILGISALIWFFLIRAKLKKEMGL